MNLSVRWLLCLTFHLLAGASAWACTICAPTDAQNTVVQRLFAADAVVLASTQAGGSGWRALEVIKGESPKAPITLVDLAPGQAGRGAPATWLLTYSAGSESWRALGSLSLARADWVRRLLAMRRAADTPVDAWPQRVAYFAPDFESDEALVAQAAYEEVSVASYAVMRTLKPALDAAKLTQWLAAPELAARRPLYTLLLGMAGDDAAAVALQARLLGPTSALNLGEHSALFAAYLEIRGSVGLEWVEQQLLRDPARPEQDLQAALLALSVHGNDGVRLSRERVVQAYAAFIRHNPSRAGMVASDLGNWERWEFVPDFAAILKSGAPQAFASRYSMVFYLMRSPTPAAREVLQALRAANLL
ncbi:hypothetical protein [Rhodoferax sp.]|uniref:hypothetical protein n=1 Tax=Rhodoferax sp. TaxID=50421 RepID=UPI00277A27A4|nr:hypothetical protein [Rhodoferax sp.]